MATENDNDGPENGDDGPMTDFPMSNGMKRCPMSFDDEDEFGRVMSDFPNDDGE